MANLVGAERVIIDAWIPEAIQTVSASLEALSPGLSDRVYLDIAPNDALYPYFIYQAQDDPVDIRGLGIDTIMVEAMYLVKAVAATEYAAMGQIVSLMHQAITTSTGSNPVVGGSILSSVKDRSFSLNEVADGNILRNLGGIYKINAQGHQDHQTFYSIPPYWWNLTGGLDFPPEARDGDYGYDENTDQVWRNVL